MLYMILNVGFMICIWNLNWFQFLGAIACVCGMEYIQRWLGKEEGKSVK